MTRSELTYHLRTLSSGTIAQAIDSTSYRIIDRSLSNAIIYATEQATDAEIAPIDDLSGIPVVPDRPQGLCPFLVLLTGLPRSDTITQNDRRKTTMTTEELAMELITHADEKPGIISMEEAKHIISMLDRNNPLPEDLNPEEFQKKWNSIILFDLPEDLWN